MPALGTQVPCCARLTASKGVPCCPRCAPTRCGRCEGLRGHHTPGCTAGFCQGCGERTAQAAQRKRGYCPRCRATRCSACKRYGGGHHPRCTFLQPRRARPRLTTVYDVVTADDLIRLFNECHRATVEFTQYVGRVSRAQAEDCVSQAFLWLWERRAVLPNPPGRGYLFKIALHRAASFKVSAWTRYVLAMDPEELLEVEEHYIAREGWRWR